MRRERENWRRSDEIIKRPSSWTRLGWSERKVDSVVQARCCIRCGTKLAAGWQSRPEDRIGESSPILYCCHIVLHFFETIVLLCREYSTVLQSYQVESNPSQRRVPHLTSHDTPSTLDPLHHPDKSRSRLLWTSARSLSITLSPSMLWSNSSPTNSTPESVT